MFGLQDLQDGMAHNDARASSTALGWGNSQVHGNA